MSALDDFSSLPPGILVNPSESYNAVQSYMRKQNKILYNLKYPNTTFFLLLIIIKHSVFCGHHLGSAEFFFLSRPNSISGLSENGTKYLFCPLVCSISICAEGMQK